MRLLWAIVFLCVFGYSHCANCNIEGVGPLIALNADDTDDDLTLFSGNQLDPDNLITKQICKKDKVPDGIDWEVIKFDDSANNGKPFAFYKSDFSKIDTVLDSTTDNSLTYTCDLTCSGGTDNLIISVTVKDVNTYAPEFSAPAYEFKLPMPLPANIDVTSFSTDLVTTKDLDFSNTEMKYTIDDKEYQDYFELTSTKNGKNYPLSIKTKAKLNLITEASFTITATDSGSPPKTSKANIKVTIDEDNSIPDRPTFIKSSYSYQYTETDGTPSITTTDTIQIDTDHPEILELTVDTEYQDKISCTKASITGSPIEVTCVYTSKDALAGIGVVFVTLTATTKKSATATLNIFMPDYGSGPQFEQAHYEGTYNKDGNTVDLKTKIKTVSVADKVDLNGEYAGDFTISINTEDKNTLDISVNPTNTFKDQDYVILELLAYTGDSKSTSTLVIEVPQAVSPKFKEPVYTGEYKEVTGKEEIIIETITVLGDDVNNIDVKISKANPDVNKYIALNYKKETGECSFTVTEPLPETILSSYKEVILTLEATEDAKSGSTAVVISLPTTDSETPKFEQTFYTGNYKVDSDNAVVELDSKIIVTGTDIILSWGDEESIPDINTYFTPNFDKGECTITAKVLPDDILQKYSEIVLTLEAKEKDGANAGSTTVILYLPTSDAGDPPTFSSSYYTGKYNKDDTISLDKEITFTNTNLNTITAKLEEGSQDIEKYLNANCDKTGCSITVTTSLPPNILDNPEIIMVLEAIEKDNSNTGKTTIILSLPSDDPSNPTKFNRIFYTGVYNDDENPPVINLNENILVISDDLSSITVALKEESIDIEKYLTPSIDKTSGEITITAKELPSDILERDDLILTIEAKGSSSTGRAILVISLPKGSNPTNIPKFEKPFYEGSYEEKEDKRGEITLKSDVIVKSDDLSSVDFKISIEDISIDVSKYLTPILDKSNGKCTIDVKEPLPLDQFVDYAYVTLWVSDTQSKIQTSATLVLSLPTTDPSNSPKFDRSYYTGVYNDDGNSPVIDLKEKILVIAEDMSSIKVALKEETIDIEKYLTPSIDKTSGEIKITAKELPSDILERDDLILSIEAQDSSSTARAILVISLPKSSKTNIPKFEKPFYEGSYKEKEDKTGEIILKSDVIVESDDLSSVDFKLTIEDISIDVSKYLTPIIDKTNGKCTIDVKEQLPLAKFVDYAYVTLWVSDTQSKIQTSATLVLSLPTTEPSEKPEFDYDYYEGTYENGVVTLEKPISVKNKVDNIDISGDYADHFKTKKSDSVDEWTIIVNSQLDDDVLHKSYIILELIAEFNSTQGRAALMIKLPGITPEFDKKLYQAAYSKDDKFSDVAIAINNYIDGVKPNLKDYTEYFSISNDGNKVTLKKGKNLPSDILNKNAYISITIQLLQDKDVIDTSVVNVNLPGGGGGNDDNDDDEIDKKNKQIKGYIAAVAVLSVLFVAGIAAFAVFYYFRLRNNESYNNLDEESITKPKTGFHEPEDSGTIKRRPTGYVFNPPPAEEDDEDDSKEHSKSVAFNEQVEELQIEPSNTNDSEDEDQSETHKEKDQSKSDELEKTGVENSYL